VELWRLIGGEISVGNLGTDPVRISCSLHLTIKTLHKSRLRRLLARRVLFGGWRLQPLAIIVAQY
ncbi:MAG: hypothetical protein WBZ35_05490, partial [Pseudolabrys sp.]